jgi:hypothetical protein
MWVRQGRTDAWIAHTLDISIDDLTRFKREHQLEGEETTTLRPADPLSVPPPDLDADVDQYDEDDDEDEDEIEHDPDRDADEEEARPSPRREGSRSRSGSRSRRSGAPRAGREERPERGERAARGPRDAEPRPRTAAPRPRDDGDDLDADDAPRRRRRGRRGGRRHRGRRPALEATFDHGEEGYGLWLDPAVADNPVYTEHWAGHRAVTVTLDAETITIRRAPAGGQPATPELDETGEPDDRDETDDYVE